MEMHLYPKVKRQALSFKGCKVVVMPDQSMSLRDIIKRFIRKESLPINREGFYEDRFGDLEKLANEDVVVQLDRAREIGDWLKKVDERNKKLEAEKAAADKLVADKLAERQAKLDALLEQKLTDPVK